MDLSAPEVFAALPLSRQAESRRGGIEKAAAEGGVMKTQKFTWSKDGAKSFEWRKIYHALVGNVGPGEGGLLAEALITPTSMRHLGISRHVHSCTCECFKTSWWQQASWVSL